MCTSDEWELFAQQAKALACWQFPNVPTNPPRDVFMLGSYIASVFRTHGHLWWPRLDVVDGSDFGYQFGAVQFEGDQVKFSVPLDEVSPYMWSVMESHQVALATKWAKKQKVLRRKQRAAILQDPEEQRSMRLLARHAVAIEMSDGRSAISNRLWANTGQDEVSQIGMLCLYYLAKALWMIASGKCQHLDNSLQFPIAGNLMICLGNGCPEVFFQNADGRRYLSVYADNWCDDPGTAVPALKELRQHRPLWRPSGLLRAIQVVSSIMALVKAHPISEDLTAPL